MSIKIAFFISYHGFGYATRAAAVMQALEEISNSVQFEIFTEAPRWLFQDSLCNAFEYHFIQTDVGLVQKSAFEIDFDGTLRCLNAFYPIARLKVTELSSTVKQLGCDAIICDIAPIGIMVGRESGIPTILIENFTWDWIYQEYLAADKRIQPFIEYLKQLFNAADYHIQTKPVCNRKAADLKTEPVSRKIYTSGSNIKERLGVESGQKVVLITTGGIPQHYEFFEKLLSFGDIFFVVPCSVQEMQTRQNVILLPHRSEFYHPDLVNAADAVVGKLGYSTLAEVYHSGVSFGYIPRPNFRESGKMAAFIETEMSGISIEESEFKNGRWTAKLSELLSISREQPKDANGADQISRFLMGLLT